MSNPRYPEEFKIQAINQVTEKKLPVSDVAARLGVSTHSLYAWIKRYSKPQEERQQDDDQQLSSALSSAPSFSGSVTAAKCFTSLAGSVRERFPIWLGGVIPAASANSKICL